MYLKLRKFPFFPVLFILRTPPHTHTPYYNQWVCSEDMGRSFLVACKLFHWNIHCFFYDWLVNVGVYRTCLSESSGRTAFLTVEVWKNQSRIDFLNENNMQVHDIMRYHLNHSSSKLL